MYLLKVGLRPLRKSFFSQVVGATCVGFVLFLGFTIFQFEKGLKPVISDIQSKEVLTVFIDSTAGANERKILIDSIESLVGAKSNYVGRKEFLESINRKYPKLGEDLYQLGSEYESIIPQYVSFKKKVSSNTIAQLKKADGVDLVATSSDEFVAALGAFKSTRWVILAMIVGLGLIFITINLYLARMSSHLQGDFVKFLRLWGAENWIARIPSLVAGGVVGLMGSVIAVTSLVVFRNEMNAWIHSLSPALRLFSFSFSIVELAGLLLIGVGGGALLGWLGSRVPKMNHNEIFV